MKPAPYRNLERFRETDASDYGTTKAHGNVGVFRIPATVARVAIVAVADDGAETGWERVACTVVHNSVERGWEPAGRAPTQIEMGRVRALFFQPDEMVFELWPPSTTHPSLHPHTRHLWKRVPGCPSKVPPAQLFSPGVQLLRKRIAREQAVAR